MPAIMSWVLRGVPAAAPLSRLLHSRRTPWGTAARPASGSNDTGAGHAQRGNLSKAVLLKGEK